MKNELMVFQNPEFGEFRTAEIDGKRWFCLADVCRPLGLQAKACRRRLKEGGVTLINTPTNSNDQKMLWVDEANLYRAIFQSVKPEAERFMDWVTEEVLPSINRTGGYSVQPKRQMTPAELLAAQANLLVELEQRTNDIERKVDRALTAMTRPEADTWTTDMKEAIRVYCEATGLTDAAGRGRLYAALDREAKCSTDARLRRLRERKKKVGETRKSYMAPTKLDAIALDGKLRSAFEGIVTRETARAAMK